VLEIELYLKGTNKFDFIVPTKVRPAVELALVLYWQLSMSLLFDLFMHIQFLFVLFALWDSGLFLILYYVTLTDGKSISCL